MGKYEYQIRETLEGFYVKGPQVGPDSCIGEYGHQFVTKLQANMAREVADAAYRAGAYAARKKMKEALGL